MANSAILATVKNCYEEEETPVGIYFDWGFFIYPGAFCEIRKVIYYTFP